MRPVYLLAAVPALAAAATMVNCSSRQGESLTGDGGGVTGTPQNEADGGALPYPTANIGTAQRGLDGSGNPKTIPGSVIADFTFLGYPGGVVSTKLEPISLASYYDPTGTKHKLLHIMAVAEWCNPCNTETSELIADLATPATDFTAEGVVFLQALIEGNTVNIGATQSDLNDWISKEHPPFDEVLDPEASNLGVFFDAAAVPFSATIDLRSMEVLQADTGQEDPASVKTWIAWVNANPPAYGAQ